MEDLRSEHKEGATPTVEQVHEHLRRGVGCGTKSRRI